MKGFSTLEIMIALVLMTLVIVASVQVALVIPLALTQSQEKLTATKIASAQLQKEFLLGLTSFSSITPIATTSLSSGYSMYAKSLTSELLSDGVTKQLTSIVSWLNAEGIIQYVIFYGLITDFDHPYPTLCPDIVSGDWLHPTVISITMPGHVRKFNSHCWSTHSTYQHGSNTFLFLPSFFNKSNTCIHIGYCIFDKKWSCGGSYKRISSLFS
jgi:hypothetical protein